MALAEMYFDESEDEKHQLLCVAGYLFKKDNAEQLQRRWTDILGRENLPYFRMVECAHGNGVFADLKEKQRIKIQTELFGVLKDQMETGISISFDLRFSHLIPSAKAHGITLMHPYTLCAYFCMMQGRVWAAANRFDGDIAYFFESGHKHQSQANHLMNEVFAIAELRAAYRYGGHHFLQKEASGALQCGDILAWQWSKYIKDVREKKRGPRADLLSLLEKPHFTIHFNEDNLIQFREVVQKSNDDAEFRKKLTEFSGF